MANAKRWNIVETRVIETHKDANGGKCVNNYALLRTLGQGRFAKVKLVERIPPPPAPPATATPTTNISSDGDAPLPAMPPVMAPLRPTFAQPPPAAAPRRQFAMKIFSKAMLSKMKDYVSQGAPRQQSDAESPPLSPSRPPPQPHSQFPSSSMRVVTALDRMRDEVRIMRTLYHRNIVLLFEVIESETSDKIYLVLEYMPQGPCMVFRPATKDFVSPITKSVLTDDLARAHTLDILHGLEYLHARGICHRDLKVH
jgi:serine/threonine protein kinase